ncbi:MAG: hypothetical protein LBE12_08050, partial [Planctomycetaceae bacterium]|nr:hypothetical protein [Planctomycetaceae bacterium]
MLRKISIIFFMFFFCVTVSADESDRLENFYTRAIPATDGFVKRLIKNGNVEPWENLSVRSLIDSCYILTSANIDLPENKRPSLEPVIPLLKLAEEMQDRNAESKTFGNFRWYWRTPEVTDRNAVEFIAAHAIPIWFESRNQLPPEARLILARILRRSIDGCLKHRVRSDYTNIAIYNFIHLIILGQIFDRPDAIQEGERRLQLFLIHIWDHGIFEYNSPTYYAVDVDALQLGLRYIKNSSTKRSIQKLLDLFWTDLTLNWFQPSFRHAGAQSRTYNYLYGVAGTTRFFDFAGLVPTDNRAKNSEYLNSFHAVYKPNKKILELNQQYPRLIVRRWGSGQGQWATSYILNDIALGTAGAAYHGARQNMVLTVDLADFENVTNVAKVGKVGKVGKVENVADVADVKNLSKKLFKEPLKFLPRNYFIADGREDPYGTKRYPTSNAGHEKPLHAEAFWFGTQRTVDALGIVIYTPETLNDPVLTNVQSHFVFRIPEAIFLDNNLIELSAEPIEVGDKPVIFRYGNKAFGIRVLWTRDKDGQSPKAFLINDGNKHGVYRLTINHWTKDVPISYGGLAAPPGAAFWVRIGSNLDSDEKFNTWTRNFANAPIEKKEVHKNHIAIQIAGTDGSISATGTELATPTFQIATEPAEPNGILTLNGNDLGRPILEQIPFIADLAKQKTELKPILVEPTGTYWEAENGFCFVNSLTVPDDEASAEKAVRVNSDIFWMLNIKQTDNYYLWARVSTTDPEHDSFIIDLAKQMRNGIYLNKVTGGAWHLGTGTNWRWIPLKLENQKTIIPLKLEQGTWRITLKPRELDGLVDRFFLTTDPNAKP